MTDDTETRVSELEADIRQSKSLPAGSENYRAYVGPPAQYDFMGATQFRLLTALGLREEHRVVDFGCGSLRAGKLLIQYLLPDRYWGIEPNEWLWQMALAQEVGPDIAALKRPRFGGGTDFAMAGIPDGWADVIVAQSVFSHAGASHVRRGLAAMARVLDRDGQILFTVLTSEAQNFARLQRGSEFEGWKYPQCVTYLDEEIEAYCRAAGLFVQKLRWFHPRQSWFRATRRAEFALTPEMETVLGTGRPLFDPRFGSA